MPNIEIRQILKNQLPLVGPYLSDHENAHHASLFVQTLYNAPMFFMLQQLAAMARTVMLSYPAI